MKNILLRLGRFVMKKTNYRIVPRSRFDDSLNLLLKKQDFFFVQIGANDGVRFDDLYIKLTQFNVHGIVIEPIQRFYNRLKLNYEDYPGVLCLNIAIHPSLKNVEIYHVTEDHLSKLEPWRGGASSVYKSHLLNNNTPNNCISSSKVKALTIDELIETYSIEHIDLLQIDVEGFDLEIIKMIPFNKIKPRLIKFEYVNLSEIQKNEALLLLNNEGYKTHIEGENAIAIY